MQSQVCKIKSYLLNNGPQPLPKLTEQTAELFEQAIEEDSSLGLHIDHNSKLLRLPDVEIECFENHSSSSRMPFTSSHIKKFKCQSCYPYLKRATTEKFIEHMLVDYNFTVWGSCLYWSENPRQKWFTCKEYRDIFQIYQYLVEECAGFNQILVKEPFCELMKLKKVNKNWPSIIKRNPIFFTVSKSSAQPTVTWNDSVFVFDENANIRTSALRRDDDANCIREVSNALLLCYIIFHLIKNCDGKASVKALFTVISSQQAPAQIQHCKITSSDQLANFLFHSSSSKIRVEKVSDDVVISVNISKEWDDLCKVAVKAAEEAEKDEVQDSLDETVPELGDPRDFVTLDSDQFTEFERKRKHNAFKKRQALQSVTKSSKKKPDRPKSNVTTIDSSSGKACNKKINWHKQQAKNKPRQSTKKTDSSGKPHQTRKYFQPAPTKSSVKNAKLQAFAQQQYQKNQRTLGKKTATAQQQKPAVIQNQKLSSNVANPGINAKSLPKPFPDYVPKTKPNQISSLQRIAVSENVKRQPLISKMTKASNMVEKPESRPQTPSLTVKHQFQKLTATAESVRIKSNQSSPSKTNLHTKTSADFNGNAMLTQQKAIGSPQHTISQSYTPKVLHYPTNEPPASEMFVSPTMPNSTALPKVPKVESKINFTTRPPTFFPSRTAPAPLIAVPPTTNQPVPNFASSPAGTSHAAAQPVQTNVVVNKNLEEKQVLTKKYISSRKKKTSFSTASAHSIASSENSEISEKEAKPLGKAELLKEMLERNDNKMHVNILFLHCQVRQKSFKNINELILFIESCKHSLRIVDCWVELLGKGILIGNKVPITVEN